MKKEYIFVQDDDSHWYLIEYNNLRKFNCWVDHMENLNSDNPEECIDLREDIDFDYCRINPSSVIIQQFRVRD